MPTETTDSRSALPPARRSLRVLRLLALGSLGLETVFFVFLMWFTGTGRFVLLGSDWPGMRQLENLAAILMAVAMAVVLFIRVRLPRWMGRADTLERASTTFSLCTAVAMIFVQVADAYCLALLLLGGERFPLVPLWLIGVIGQITNIPSQARLTYTYTAARQGRPASKAKRR